MRVNYLDAKCSTKTSEKKFGLCDDDNKKPAYINLDNEAIWIATVVNNAGKSLQFTAIDNCIEILNHDKSIASRCDVMLYYENRLFLVELKTKRKDWKAEGLEQIEATIKRMLVENKKFYLGFAKRLAIVANNKRTNPCFQDFDAEKREYFKKEYKIHIQFEAEIVIK